MAKKVSREEFEALKAKIQTIEDDVSRNGQDVDELFDRTDSLKKELIEQRRQQIDIARQSYKTCIVLSGKDIPVWRNEKKAFMHLAKEVFGINVGYFDIEVTLIDT